MIFMAAGHLVLHGHLHQPVLKGRLANDSVPVTAFSIPILNSEPLLVKVLN